ncbi:beta-ketoacyl-[acyl-carrier-protein] synthase family protein [Actinocatenispora comari]|uniref:3-oxoacyl-ACP synthase n=1 Tax=Actinocatenispora comari TaxID=2807577 RepID=A0A8J4AJT5_9ACTN|nr:beta-ketoacyl-[acyl-carrier-protein] synthase family protein [Actinocatenispora comari]GIL31890.1 3-oxoacyl-ACP synthase [Actinocatenispora comari]
MATTRNADRRVVVTGLGAVSSVGIGAHRFGASLRAGRSGARPISAFDTTGFAHSVGCEVTGFDPAAWLTRFRGGKLGRATEFAAAGARMAVVDAGLRDEDTRRRFLVSVGTTDGESRDLDRLTELTVAGGGTSGTATIARRIPASRLSTAIAHELGLVDAETVTLATACAAGNYAIGYGCDAIRSGEVDFALCGGADALCRKTFAGFYRLGTIAPARCQPFDAERQGILTGEGAGILLLESLASARSRGARIYAEVLGYGLNCDADHQVAPNLDSVARCMRLALADAGIEPAEVDFISAHGTGTRANDVTESRAIHQVFGEAPPRTVSIKSMIGHTMGAASALAAVGCSLAIADGFIPPTINHVRTDPECDLDCVPNEAIDAELRVVQNNGLAFGGNNAVVVFGSVR